MLTDCGEACAKTRAEAIREAIAGVPISVGDVSLHVSISIGAITLRNWESGAPIGESSVAGRSSSLSREDRGEKSYGLCG